MRREVLMGDRRLVVAFLCAVLANGATGALAQSGGPQFRVLSPLAGSLQGNSVEVRIAITSQTPVAAAGATLDNAGAPLVGSGSELRGSLDSSTLPRGSRIVAITVRDVNSRSTTARIPVVIDRKPVLTVTAPAADTVFTPSNAGIRFAASCADDGPGGCTALRVVFNGTVVAAGRSGIDVTLTKLPHSATGADNVVFIGTDSAGQTVRRTVGVQYESSARLVPVLETPGPILDASADRVLFTDAQRKHLAIRHRDTQADEQIQLPAGTLSASDARLTPHGAAFVALFTTLEPTKICEWRDGALLVLGQSSAAKLVGNQRFMAWVEQDATDPDQAATLKLYDLEAGTTEIVDVLERQPFEFAAGPLWDVDVDQSGVVTYWKLSGDTYAIWRYSRGARTEAIAAPSTWSVTPRSDGILTAYKQHVMGSAPAIHTQLQVGSATVTLADWPLDSNTRPRAGTDFQVRDGYVAFTRPAGGEKVSIWTRAPDGSQRIVWPAVESAIHSLGPHGALLFGAGEGNELAVYEAAPGRRAKRVCALHGRTIWIDDELYVAEENVLFRVLPAAGRPLLTIDTPHSGTSLQPFALSGWALDREAADVSGIDTVHVWAFPASGAAPTFMGAAAMNLSRPDVAKTYGAQFAHAGFSLRIAGLAPGAYRLTAYAHSAYSNAFVASTSITVSVPSQVRVVIDTPVSGVVQRVFAVAGWALDGAAASGTGINRVQIYAYPQTGAVIYLGSADVAIRPDVAAAFGAAFARAGYGLVVARLAPGRYTLAVFARSAITGQYAPAATRAITVSP